MKICVIGNSHAGAWKLAWEKIATRYPGISIRFFASAGATLQHLYAEGGLLRTRNADVAEQLRRSAGADTIDPAEYDRFCLVGCRVVAHPLVMLYEAWRAESHRGRAGDPTLISDACFEAAARGAVSQSVGIELCRKLVKLTARPVTLVPQPMPSEAILASPLPQQAPWRMAHDAGDDTALAALFTRLVRELCPGQVEPLGQPRATLFAPLSTLDRYSRDTARRARPGSADKAPDYFHMSTTFGRLALAEYFAAIGVAGTSHRADERGDAPHAGSVARLPGFE